MAKQVPWHASNARKHQYFPKMYQKTVVFKSFHPHSRTVGVIQVGVDEAGRGCLAGPVVAGATLLPAGFFGKAAKRISILSPLVSVLCIILIVGYILADKHVQIKEHWRILVLAVMLLHAVGFGLGYGLARLLRFDEQSSRTVSIEVGMQNSGLGAALAKAHFSALAAVPCAVSAVTHCILGSIAAGLWRLIQPKSTTSRSLVGTVATDHH